MGAFNWQQQQNPAQSTNLQQPMPQQMAPQQQATPQQQMQIQAPQQVATMQTAATAPKPTNTAQLAQGGITALGRNMAQAAAAPAATPTDVAPEQGGINVAQRFDEIMSQMQNQHTAQQEMLNRRAKFMQGQAASVAGRMGGGMGGQYMAGQRQAQNNINAQQMELGGQQSGQIAHLLTSRLQTELGRQADVESQIMGVAETLLAQGVDPAEAYELASEMVGTGGIGGLPDAVSKKMEGMGQVGNWNPSGQDPYHSAKKQQIVDNLYNELKRNGASDAALDKLEQIGEEYTSGTGTEADLKKWADENVPGYTNDSSSDADLAEEARNKLKISEKEISEMSYDAFKAWMYTQGGYKGPDSEIRKIYDRARSKYDYGG